MRTPSRASISARRRGIVQLRRSATGCSSKGMATRKAASLFTGGGPGATLVFSAATPLTAKSLRHRRTARTPNASAILELVQPASVKSTARARSATPRSRDSARAKRPARCSSLAVTGDFPAMPYTLRIGAGSEPQKTYPLVSRRESPDLQEVARGSRQPVEPCDKQSIAVAKRGKARANSRRSVLAPLAVSGKIFSAPASRNCLT